MLARIRQWAKALKRDTLALWIAARDLRTPLVAKLLALAVATYAFSPIDLIPDFIPVLGLLDDMVILPLGIALAIRLIPASLMAEYRASAQALADRPTSKYAAAIIILIWVVVAVLVGWWILIFYGRG